VLFNKTDGTLYSLDTAIEMMENRFMQNEWADVSDILGSDWGKARGNALTSEQYQTAAFAVAPLIYRNGGAA
jgi:hypothetical protein